MKALEANAEREMPVGEGRGRRRGRVKGHDSEEQGDGGGGITDQPDHSIYVKPTMCQALSTGFNINHVKAAHLTDEETETQRDLVTFSKSQASKW